MPPSTPRKARPPSKPKRRRKPKINKPTALYIHIPFCRNLCAYCSFPRSILRPDWAFSYVERLLEDLAPYPAGAFRTAYIGGGTPSSLPRELLDPLLKRVGQLLSPGYEWTFEANPEDVDEKAALLLADAGVNRVSMGLQSARPLALRLLGRKHSFETAAKAVDCLRRAGIDNISLDLIYGLPGETLDEVRFDIERLLSLDPTHFSTYSLEIHENTPLKKRGFTEASDDIMAEHLGLIGEEGAKRGYRRYEISSFAKPGFEARHNLVYWHDEEYVGVGMGAAGYEQGIRYQNPAYLVPYLDKCPREEERVEGRAEKEFFLLTNLRLADGFRPEDYETRCSSAFFLEFGEAFRELEKEGLIAYEGGRVKPTPSGMNLLDRLLLRLYNSIR